MSNWNRIFATFVFLSPIAAFGQLDLGTRLTSARSLKNSNLVCAATPSQFYPCIQDLKVNGVMFSAVGYDSKAMRVKYLATSDTQFRAKEGLRVGDWIEMSEDPIIFFPGWKIYGPKTKDGWHIVLGTTLLGKEITFQDGTVVSPSISRKRPSRIGKVQIVEFEKGGV